MKKWIPLVFESVLLFTVGFILLHPYIAFGVEFDPGGTLKSSTELSNTDANTYVFTIIKGFLTLVGVVALVLIIYGGFIILIARGDNNKIQKGKDTLFWAIIGTLIILASLGIVNFLEGIL